MQKVFRVGLMTMMVGASTLSAAPAPKEKSFLLASQLKKKNKRRDKEQTVEAEKYFWEGNPLRLFEAMRMRIHVGTQKRDALKAQTQTKETRAQLETIEETLAHLQSKWQQHYTTLLTSWTQRKDAAVPLYNTHKASYSALLNKQNKTASDFGQMRDLAQEMARAEVQINQAENLIRQIKLTDMYAQIDAIRPRLKALTDIIISDEFQLLQAADPATQSALDLRIYQYYAEVMALQGQSAMLEGQIAPLSQIYLHGHAANDLVKANQATEEAQYAELKRRLQTPPAFRATTQIQTSRDRLEQIIWWRQQETLVRENPGYIRQVQPPAKPAAVATPARPNASSHRTQITESQKNALYQGQMNRQRLNGFIIELQTEQNRLQTLLNRGGLSISQRNETTQARAEIETLLNMARGQFGSAR